MSTNDPELVRATVDGICRIETEAFQHDSNLHHQVYRDKLCELISATVSSQSLLLSKLNQAETEINNLQRERNELGRNAAHDANTIEYQNKSYKELEQKLAAVEKERDFYAEEADKFEEEMNDAYNERDQLHSLTKKLVEALKQYGNHEQWRKNVPDSYSGEVCEFDWEGDLANEPWDFAEKALQLAKEAGVIE